MGFNPCEHCSEIRNLEPDDSRDPCETCRLELAESEVEKLQELIKEFADNEPCKYDHYGYCQTHTEHPRPCPYERANEMRNIEDVSKRIS
jgi:hypothetical protein